MQVTLPAPYQAQLPVLRACFDAETVYIVANGGRQVGKTVLCTIAAIKWALETSNQCVMLVSPTDSQVKKIYKQMLHTLTPLFHFISAYKIQAGDSEIIFKNGSSILFRSAASENSLRGYSNTHLILDECAFMKESTWQTILAPSLSVKGKKCLFCSTPKGNNFFARLYGKGVDGSDPMYKAYKLTFHNNPFANLPFIEEQKLVLPDEIFRQEYLGEFIDAAGCFRTINEIATSRRSYPMPSDSYYVGVDIAMKNDYTVAVCLDGNKKMVDMLRFNNTDISHIVSELKKFFMKWNPKKIMIESNNQGLPIIQTLKNQGVQRIEEFATTASSKPLIINNLIAAANKKELTILNEDIVKSEFNAFVAEVSPTGHIKYHGAYGHDDIVMATAIANECQTRNKFHKAFAVGR